MQLQASYSDTNSTLLHSKVLSESLRCISVGLWARGPIQITCHLQCCPQMLFLLLLLLLLSEAPLYVGANDMVLVRDVQAT